MELKDFITQVLVEVYRIPNSTKPMRIDFDIAMVCTDKPYIAMPGDPQQIISRIKFTVGG